MNEKSKDPMTRLMVELGYRFVNPTLLQRALTHRSYVNECSDHVRDNERFEFLGDAVIDLVVSEELMSRHPDAREGPLSKMRATIVSEGGLARIAEAIRLGEALRLGRGEELSGGRDKPSILADAFEAVIAAVFVDSGIESARKILLATLEFPSSSDMQFSDPKTELQQRIQGDRHITPSYRLVEESGPDHEKSFRVEIVVEDEVWGEGRGRTKKEAEQQAAARVLEERFAAESAT